MLSSVSCATYIPGCSGADTPSGESAVTPSAAAARQASPLLNFFIIILSVNCGMVFDSRKKIHAIHKFLCTNYTMFLFICQYFFIFLHKNQTETSGWKL